MSAVVWLKLDDSFHDNAKVVRAGNAAVGLWVKCAVWSARQLTDGRIPADIVRSLGRPTEAQTLERVGLWVLADGEYVIPDWLEYNPSALEVKQRRAQTLDAKRRAGMKRANGARRDPSGQFIADEETST